MPVRSSTSSVHRAPRRWSRGRLSASGAARGLVRSSVRVGLGASVSWHRQGERTARLSRGRCDGRRAMARIKLFKTLERDLGGGLVVQVASVAPTRSGSPQATVELYNGQGVYQA